MTMLGATVIIEYTNGTRTTVVADYDLDDNAQRKQFLQHARVAGNCGIGAYVVFPHDSDEELAGAQQDMARAIAYNIGLEEAQKPPTIHGGNN